MSSIPASAITSASPSFWQVMPLAPAAICSFASTGLLWVFMCGRLARPAASQVAWIRAMLRSTRSMSMTAAGVPYSRAILAASGVVMGSGLFDLFAQHFKFQPFVFGGLELLLGGRERGRGDIEFLAILLIEIGIVKMALLLCDFGLKPGDRPGQRFQRVFFVEIEPALRNPRRRAAFRFLLVFGR